MINQRNSFLIFLFLSFIILFASPSWAVKLKIATLSPDGSMWMTKMREAANQIAKETDNRVKFKFYPGGVMGNDSAVLRKIRIGQLHGGALMGGSLSRFFPSNQIYAQPIKFSRLEEVEYIRKYMDQYIIDGLDEAGFVTFGLSGLGFSYIMSQEPVRTVADLKNKKVWIPKNDKINLDSISAFGISPIPLPLADVLTSLQSSLIDTVANSPAGAVILQWHTQIKYVTNVPLIYLHGVFTIDKKKYMKISEKDREIIRTIMTATMKEVDLENRKTDLAAIETLKKRGITFITPTKEEMQSWIQTGRTASQKMLDSGVLPQKVVDQMDKHLTDYHAGVGTNQ